MELRHLRYFIKAAELLHFTKAAEALYISQPSLSVHIQQLEAEFGTELFARVGRHVRLTEAGEILLARARQAVSEIELATAEIDALTGLMRGTLNLAALPLFNSYYLPNWIIAFNRAHPDVHVRVRSGTSEDIESGITCGAIDLGITVLPLEHPEFNTQELFCDQAVVVVSENHPLAAKSKLEVRDFHRLEMALPSSRAASLRPTRAYFEEYDVLPSVIVEQDDGHALLAMARTGRVAVVLPARSAVNLPGLRCFPFPERSVSFTAVAAWLRLSPPAKAFLQVAEREAKAIVAATN